MCKVYDVHLRSLSDYCHLVNSPCNELYTISRNEGPSPQVMYLTGDNKKWLGHPVPFPSGKPCFLPYFFFWRLSNLLLKASEDILPMMVIPSNNIPSCLRYTHMYAELSLCIASKWYTTFQSFLPPCYMYSLNS